MNVSYCPNNVPQMDNKVFLFLFLLSPLLPPTSQTTTTYRAVLLLFLPELSSRSPYLAGPWPRWTACPPAWCGLCRSGQTSGGGQATDGAALWVAGRPTALASACSGHPQTQPGRRTEVSDPRRGWTEAVTGHNNFPKINNWWHKNSSRSSFSCKSLIVLSKYTNFLQLRLFLKLAWKLSNKNINNWR